jgi:hypothetical protein
MGKVDCAWHRVGSGMVTRVCRQHVSVVVQQHGAVRELLLAEQSDMNCTRAYCIYNTGKKFLFMAMSRLEGLRPSEKPLG